MKNLQKPESGENGPLARPSGSSQNNDLPWRQQPHRFEPHQEPRLQLKLSGLNFRA